MSITVAERHEIAELLVVMWNATPGATYLSQIVSAYEANGHSLSALANVLGATPAYQATHPNFWSSDDFADHLLTPLGLQNDFQARTAVENAFNSGVPMHRIEYAAYTFLNDVLANPSFYASQYVTAANIMDNKADVSIYFSVTKGLSAFTLADLQAPLEGVDQTDASVIAAEEAIDHANDPQTFNVSVDAPTVTEGDAGTKLLTFTITMTDAADGGATNSQQTINWSTTTGGTATAGDDYVSQAGTVTFAPGQSVATVSITVLGDTVFEPSETVRLAVSGGALVAGQTATGTILNDDPTPQTFVAAIDSPTVTEGDAGTKIMNFTVTLDQAPTVPVTFSYETMQGSGTATAGSDYVAGAGTVTFGVGQTVATVSVVVQGDTMPEDDETIALHLFGGQLPGDAFAIGTILNDDDFDLTPGRDVIPGSPFDDVINGTQDTFTLADEINGGDGFDELLLVFDGIPSSDPDVIIAPFVEVSDVELVTIISDLSVGSDGGQAFDMSDWFGVETIDIRTAGGADVNIMSNASDLVQIEAGDNVELSDNTVDEVIVDAGGDADITAFGASAVTVDADDDVFLDTSDADIEVNAGDFVDIDTDDGNIDVTAGGSVDIESGDADTIDVVSSDDVEIDASDVGTLTVVASDAVDIGVMSADFLDATGSEGTQVTATDLVGGLFSFQATVLISGEDNEVDVMAGSATHIGVSNAEDTDIDVGMLESVTLSDDIGAVNIAEWSDSDGALMLTLSDSFIDLTINSFFSDTMTDLDLVVISDSGVDLMGDVQNIDLTGDGDLSLDTDAVGGILETINGGTFTGDLDLDATGAITVTSGTGDDSIIVDGGVTSDADVTVDAGAGSNFVDVDSNGNVDVTVGDSDDTVVVNFDALEMSDSSVALGAGDNTLVLRSRDAITDEDLDAFDLTALPITGSLGTLDISANVELSSDSESTLDVSGLDGSVHTIMFSDVDVFGDPAALTIMGTGPVLQITSEESFGSDDEVIILEAAGVTGLSIDADDVGVELMGDDVVTLDIDSTNDIELILDGDTNGDGVQDQLGALTTIDLAAETDIDLEISNIRTGATVNVFADSNLGGAGAAFIDIDNSTLGNVTVDFGTSGEQADLEISGTMDSTVTVGDVTVNDGGESDGDGDSTIDMEVNDNDGSLVTIGDTDLAADGDVDLEVSDNNHATVNMGDVDLLSRSDSATMSISWNIDNEAGADAIVNVSDVTITASEDATLLINSNSDSAITLGDVDIDSFDDGEASLMIDDNSESTVDIGNIDVSAAYGNASVVVSDNDGAEVELGNVTVTSTGGFSDAFVEINFNDDSDISAGNVTVNGFEDAWLDISENDDTSVTLGNVVIGAGSDAYFSISDNIDADIEMGTVTMTASDDANVSIDGGSNSESDISISDMDITAGDDVFFNIAGWANSDGSTNVGDIDVDGGGEVFFNVEDIDSAGDITVSAGDDANVTVDEVDGVTSIDVSAGSDAYVTVSDMDDLSTLTVAASDDATIELDGVNSDAAFTLDISGVMGTAMVDASDADFDSTGLFTTILIGDGDVTYENDLVNGGANDESRELFMFGAGASDDVGMVTIDNFRPGATAAVDGVWTDRLDFSELDGVDSLDDITFTNDGTDVIIDFVDPDLGSITLTGVGAAYANATDLVVASIVF